MRKGRIMALMTAITILCTATPVFAETQSISSPSTATVAIGATVASEYVVTLPTAVPAASFTRDTGVGTLPSGSEAAYKATFVAAASGNIPADKKVTLSLTAASDVTEESGRIEFPLFKDGDTSSSDKLNASISFFGNSYTTPAAAQTACEWMAGSVDTSSLGRAENLGTDVTAYIHYFTAHKAGNYSRNLSFTIGYEDI